MTKTAQHSVKVTSGKYETIASGIVHLTEEEVTFDLANLIIKYKFISDSEGTRFNSKLSDEKELIISLYNFTNTIGEGKIEPLEIGLLDNRKLFATFFVSTPEKNLRQFTYTFMLKEA